MGVDEFIALGTPTRRKWMMKCAVIAGDRKELVGELPAILHAQGINI